MLDATDIVRLIGEYVTLRPAGREFKGLCPFHDDTNPSMSVVPHKGIFHCFACGTGGDALRFIRLHQHVEFREALKFLAERAGIEITPWRPDRGGEEGPAGEHEVEAYSTAEIVEAPAPASVGPAAMPTSTRIRTAAPNHPRERRSPTNSVRKK